jgi:L-amino acid N-acyltransferase YncA
MTKIRTYDKNKDLEEMTEILDTFKQEMSKKHLYVHEKYADIKYYKEKFLGIADVILAEENKKIAGFAVLEQLDPPKNDTYWLTIIYVAPNHRGKDVAKGLMKKFLDTAYEKGYKKAQSKVAKENQNSVVLHRKMGFYNDHFLNESEFYRMTKRIK